MVVLVAGLITVAPGLRDSYLAGCVSVVEQARDATGCLDFGVIAGLVDLGRINVFERWTEPHGRCVPWQRSRRRPGRRDARGVGGRVGRRGDAASVTPLGRRDAYGVAPLQWYDCWYRGVR